MSGTTLDSPSENRQGDPGQRPRAAHLLVLAWCPSAPARIGEVLAVPEEGAHVFGREPAADERSESRVRLARERPGALAPALPLVNPFLSRTQLRLRAAGDALQVDNLGRRKMLIDGCETRAGHVVDGSLLEIEGQLLFFCTRRPEPIPACDGPHALHAFGEADAHGIVGESPACWALRSRLHFAAARNEHVLILGESGTGKELIAQALHQLSARGRRKMVSRNAATLPNGLIDAELFGNTANYPNAGMAERPGLVGEADGSTLFLDEIGELPGELQSHLLRLLDGGGEYHRLGESKRRTADIRIVAATNRAAASLKLDLAARLRMRIQVPGLNERREDIPLLVRHVLQRTVAHDAKLAARFAARGAITSAEPVCSAALVSRLLLHRYQTHVRELEALLWEALAVSSGPVVDVCDSPQDAPASPPARTIGPDEIRASLERHAGVQERVWRELGLPNRYVLKRLIRKFGIAVEPPGDAGND